MDLLRSLLPKSCGGDNKYEMTWNQIADSMNATAKTTRISNCKRLYTGGSVRTRRARFVGEEDRREAGNPEVASGSQGAGPNNLAALSITLVSSAKQASDHQTVDRGQTTSVQRLRARRSLRRATLMIRIIGSLVSRLGATIASIKITQYTYGNGIYRRLRVAC
jgi:hypothetical protein